jgi:hypothetical protein
MGSSLFFFETRRFLIESMVSCAFGFWGKGILNYSWEWTNQRRGNVSSSLDDYRWSDVGLHRE